MRSSVAESKVRSDANAFTAITKAPKVRSDANAFTAITKAPFGFEPCELAATPTTGTSGEVSDGNGVTRWAGNYSSELASCSMHGAADRAFGSLPFPFSLFGT